MGILYDRSNVLEGETVATDLKLERLVKTEADGFAMVSVLFVLVLMGVLIVPIMDLALSSKKSTIRQKTVTHLVQQARQTLEAGVYLVKRENGVPTGYSNVPSPAVREMAIACSRRIAAVDPDFLGSTGLSDKNNVFSSGIMVQDTRNVVTFIVTKSRDPRYQRYVIVTCARSKTNLLGIYAAELAALNGTYYRVSAGSF